MKSRCAASCLLVMGFTVAVAQGCQDPQETGTEEALVVEGNSPARTALPLEDDALAALGDPSDRSVTVTLSVKPGGARLPGGERVFVKLYLGPTDVPLDERLYLGSFTLFPVEGPQAPSIFDLSKALGSLDAQRRRTFLADGKLIITGALAPMDVRTKVSGARVVIECFEIDVR